MATPLERQRKLFEERERKILKVRELRDQGMRQCDIARELEIAQPTVVLYLRMTETQPSPRKAKAS